MLLLLVGGASLTITSCSDWLDVSPKSSVKGDDLFKYESGFLDILTGVYILIGQEEVYGQTMTYEFVDILAQYYVSAIDNTYASMDIQNFDYTDSDVELQIEGIWTNTFYAIANLNYALSKIDENKDVFSTEAIYKVYKGEMLALRAMLHLDLLRLFAPSPKGDEGLDAYAIPFVDTYTVSPSNQLTIQEVADKLIADLITAQDLMRDNDPFGPSNVALPDNADLSTMFAYRRHRMNYYATSTLLARAYTYFGYGDEAYAVAKTTIEEMTTKSSEMVVLATTAATSADPYFESEMLFELNVPTLDDMLLKIFYENGYSYSSVLAVSTADRDNMFYTTGTGLDYRYSNLFKNHSYSGYYIPHKYDEQEYIPMLRASELYLIVAEFAPEAEGLEYLNTIRAHRGLNALETTENLQDEIYYEYRREFMCEGQLFYYYKRNLSPYMGPRDNVAMTDFDNYTLPIPTDELDFGNIVNQ